MKRFASAAALLLALLALAGCTETRFESPLGDRIETCDAAWKGLWVDPADEAPGLFVDNDCRLLVLEQPEKGGPLKPIHVPLNYVHLDGGDYIVIADNQLKGLVDLKTPYAIKPTPEKSFFFAKYKVRGDKLELWDVDSEKVAKLVIDGKLDGTVSKADGELHVYVRGDRARMLEIVRKQSIFSSKQPTVLVRRKQALADYEQDLIRAQHAGKKR